MLIEAPLGNLFADPSVPNSGADVDWLDLTWSECSRRAQRKQTRAGELARLLLRVGVSLRHGDILRQADGGGEAAIAVNVLPCEVLVARPSDRESCAELCYELGSLHVPMQLDGDQIITICDGPVEAVFDRLNMPFETHTRRFQPTLYPPGQVAISGEFALTQRATTGHPTA